MFVLLVLWIPFSWLVLPRMLTLNADASAGRAWVTFLSLAEGMPRKSNSSAGASIMIGSCCRDRTGDTPHTPLQKCLRLYDGAPPPAPDLIPAENERSKLNQELSFGWVPNGGHFSPNVGKTNGAQRDPSLEPYPLRRAWTPVLHNQSSESSIRVGWRQQFVSGLEQDNSHADAHGYGFSAGGCS
jgi:hypothetical protein